jgi:hypothetical protein
MTRLSRSNPSSHPVEAIDEELREVRHHSLDAERLRFARWVLTVDDDELAEALAALEDEGIWDPSDNLFTRFPESDDGIWDADSDDGGCGDA